MRHREHTNETSDYKFSYAEGRLDTLGGDDYYDEDYSDQELQEEEEEQKGIEVDMNDMVRSNVTLGTTGR